MFSQNCLCLCILPVRRFFSKSGESLSGGSLIFPLPQHALNVIVSLWLNFPTCFSSLNINAPHAEQMSIFPTSRPLTVASLKTSKFCLAMGNLCASLCWVISCDCFLSLYQCICSVLHSVVCLFLYHLLVFVWVCTCAWASSSFDESESSVSVSTGVLSNWMFCMFDVLQVCMFVSWLMLCDTIVQLVFASCPVFCFFLG